MIVKIFTCLKHNFTHLRLWDGWLGRTFSYQPTSEGGSHVEFFFFFFYVCQFFYFRLLDPLYHLDFSTDDDLDQSGTKSNMVAIIWPPTLVTICAWLPTLVAKVSSHFTCKLDTIWVVYRQVSIIRRTLIRNKLVDHSDVVGASPVGAAPTTSSWST